MVLTVQVVCAGYFIGAGVPAKMVFNIVPASTPPVVWSWTTEGHMLGCQIELHSVYPKMLVYASPSGN
jgi:hypothetical protein